MIRESSTGVWRRHVEPFSRPFFFALSRLQRGKTLGVRVLAQNAEGHVLLVEHTYLPGWWLPGGGVDNGETAEAAAARELLEETGLKATTRPKLLSVHDNSRFFPNDHVLLYRIDAFEPAGQPRRDEIVAAKFFPLDALPDNINRPSKRRLDEVLGGQSPDALW